MSEERYPLQRDKKRSILGKAKHVFFRFGTEDAAVNLEKCIWFSHRSALYKHQLNAES